MKMALLGLHLLVSMTLITLILLQTSKGGLGSAFGGGAMYRTKRGAERVVFIATFVFSFLFLITSVINMFV